MPMSEKPSFGQKLAELEKITAQVEDGEVDLDKGLKQVERGMQLLKELKHRLGEVENDFKEIKRKYQPEDEPSGGPPAGNEEIPF